MSLVHAIKTGNSGVKTVKRVQFAVLSPEKILSGAVADIHKHMTKGGELQGTLQDPRLGATRNTRNSITGLDSKLDPGLFGYCILTLPVYHPIYDKTIHNVLRVVCPACSSLRESSKVKVEHLRALISKQRIVKSSKLSYVQALLGKPREPFCLHCGAELPDVVVDKKQIIGFAFAYTGEDKKKKDRVSKNPMVIYDILKKISDSDCELIGLDPKYSRPEWMMYTILPVPPPTMRPSVIADNDKTSDDDITQSLHNIIKINNILKGNMEESKIGLDDPNILSTWQSLQSQVAALVDNETNSYGKVCNRAQRPLKTLKGRHKGKPGRLRNNLMGKRTNFSARTVITADPNLGLDEVGVPYDMALILTYGEIVNEHNIDALTTLVRRGPNVYPGAKEIKKPGQSFTIDLDCIKDRESIRLEYGTIVYRHLIDGDIVLFNRQPSLHRMNMMAHYVRILPGRSFRISANITQPYGADFDGDEMNLHLPQCEITRREIEELALSPTQMVSPQSSAPVVGAVQDTMLATYRASSEQTRGYQVGERYYLNVKDFMNLTFWITNTPDLFPIMSSDDGWTMHDLINMILPPITVTRTSKVNRKHKLCIVNGKLTIPECNEGVMVPMAKSNSILGASAGSIFHVTCNDLGPIAAKNLMDDLSRVMSQWLMQAPVSVGLRDLEIPRVYMNEIAYDKMDHLDKADKLIEGLHGGKYTDSFRESLGLGARGLTSNNYEQFEQDIMFILDTCRNRVQEYVADHIDEYTVGRRYDNRFMSMVKSGSKGKPTNAVQIVGTLGQQVIAGARANDYYYRRPLPFVPKDDLSPEGRGFVLSSYNEGLNFLEYIYHAMAGRIGVISTSIKTAETGYLQRKLMKRLEDIGCFYDGTVRLAGGAIVQYVYGGDGFDGVKIERQQIDYITSSIDELKLKYEFSKTDWDEFENFTKSADGFTLDYDVEKSAIDYEVEQLEKDWKYIRDRYPYNLPESIPSVVNFERLIDGLKSRMGASGSLPYLNADDVLTPSYIGLKINKLVTEDLRLPTNNHINEHCMKQFVALLRSKMSSKYLIMVKGYNRMAFDELLEEIHYKFYNGIVTPGEAVGAIAAQSIGEPGTQMTLDAFHSTGAKITVSGGVPRFKEILSLTKVKTPSVSIYLQGIAIPDEISSKADGAQTITEIDAYLMRLSQSGQRDAAKKLKKQFVKSYLNNGENAILKVRGNFEYVKLSDLVTSSEVYYVPNETLDPDQKYLKYYNETSTEDTVIEYPIWLIKFNLDRDAVANVATDLGRFVRSGYGTGPSINLTYLETGADEAPILRGILGKDVGSIGVLNQKEAELLGARIRGISDIIQTTVRKERRDIRLGGTYGKVIRRCDSEYNDLADIMLGADDYIIDTVGSNLTDILGMDFVDPYRTITNDINEMQRTFGIEVGRKSIIREIDDVLVTSAKADIGNRHLSLLADAMTCRGFMQKIDRYGAKKGESGPLALASFEETTTILCKAAVYSEEDSMTGVSSNVMFGQFIKLGTNSFDVYLDEAMIIEHGVPTKYEKDLPAVLDMSDIEACGDESMQFDFTL